MKPGKIIKQFSSKDGKEVILRTPKWEDLDDLLFYVNSLVDEQAEVGRTSKMTRSKEADWLGRHLGAIENDRKLAIVAEVDARASKNKPNQLTSKLNPVYSTGYLIVDSRVNILV